MPTLRFVSKLSMTLSIKFLWVLFFCTSKCFPWYVFLEKLWYFDTSKIHLWMIHSAAGFCGVKYRPVLVLLWSSWVHIKGTRMSNERINPQLSHIKPKYKLVREHKGYLYSKVLIIIVSNHQWYWSTILNGQAAVSRVRENWKDGETLAKKSWRESREPLLSYSPIS